MVSDQGTCEYDRRGEVEREQAAELAAEAITEQERAWTGLIGDAIRSGQIRVVDDPGPVPEVVEPETVGRRTTIPARPGARRWVHVTEDVGRTGLVGLTLATEAESITVALSPAAVDAVIEALMAATPAPYEPVATRRTGGDPGE